MANLPWHRVTPARPFLHAGVDFAGPIFVRAMAGRGQVSHKTYICVFVCCATKAVHLELAMDLSSEGFLSAFRRFISRRGRCTHLYSDNGTNFVGASKDLRELFTNYQAFYRSSSAVLTGEGTTWSFIPPAAPHFGGLWEAGVKSAKYHLKRVAGTRLLSFDEMTTLLCQIEACLNSRPLTELSHDPDDLRPLTPGHFLIGEATTAMPEPGTLQLPSVQLLRSRYLQICQMRDSFWQRWSREYLNDLQQRQKWHGSAPEIGLDTLVVIRSPDSPPAEWRLGRVTRIFPDQDGVVRKVSLRTANGALDRPVTQLIILPVPPPDAPATSQSPEDSS